jgi:hypothetical protein
MYERETGNKAINGLGDYVKWLEYKVEHLTQQIKNIEDIDDDYPSGDITACPFCGSVRSLELKNVYQCRLCWCVWPKPKNKPTLSSPEE